MLAENKEDDLDGVMQAKGFEVIQDKKLTFSNGSARTSLMS